MHSGKIAESVSPRVHCVYGSRSMHDSIEMSTVISLITGAAESALPWPGCGSWLARRPVVCGTTDEERDG